jgi:hypothetical protein
VYVLSAGHHNHNLTTEDTSILRHAEARKIDNIPFFKLNAQRVTWVTQWKAVDRHREKWPFWHTLATKKKLSATELRKTMKNVLHIRCS